ncbi:hypothetical protein GGF37_005904 [Kickxella alabastrina]|nr:hypothetical protein GGF37_005904 [Kickxella alabastrina]
MSGARNVTLVYSYTLGNEYPPPMIEYEPVRWVAYLMSALFPLLAVRVLMVARSAQILWFSAAGFGCVLVFIALVLRGAMGADEEDAFRVYETQTVLHLCAGFVLVGVMLGFAAKWIEFAARGIVAVFLTHMAIGYSVAVVICTCVGIPLMFDASEAQRKSGYKLVSVSIIVSIGFILLAVVLTLYHTQRGGGIKQRGTPKLPIVIIPAALLVVWMSFALARVSLPMSSVANTSDALFYCMSVLPAAGAVVVWTAMTEEFTAEGAGDAAGTGGGCRNNESVSELGMQAAPHTMAPCVNRSSGVALTNVIGPVVVDVRFCYLCSGGGGTSATVSVARPDRLCAKCKYEAMLQRAMHQYV